ncbi:MAG TPA: pilus assembly protein TadG-related protein [Acidimicrobiia bacterium]|nr:pilus assembly protein TadG-related protein [Acidimicrobiia bacterium]
MIAPRHDDERGAVLVMMAVLLVVLLGITALAVDLGVGRAHKREVQSGADAGALGGAQELIPNPTASLSDAENEARGLEADNVADFEDGGWAGCTDGNALPNTNGTSDCISFDTSFTRIRVQSPAQEISTLFGRIWNRDTLITRAAAEAQIAPVGFGTVLPFGLGSAFQLPEGCLKTSTGGQAIPPCDGPDTGNFGFLDIRQYGNAALQTQDRCGQGQPSDRLRNNVAIGVDHLLTTYSGTEVRDEDCVPFPNTLAVATGNAQQRFAEGLIKSDPGATEIDDLDGGRLRRGQYPKTSVLTKQVDNKPLYQFIPSGSLTDAPRSCWRDNFDNVIANFPTAQERVEIHNHLQKCFWEYRCGRVDQAPANVTNGSCTGPRGTPSVPLPVSECGADRVCTGVVFGLNSDPFGDEGDPDLWDIQLTPRFAYVPQFQETIPGPGGSQRQHIIRFRAVYLQRIDAQCGGQSCGVQFEPGPWNSGNQGGGNVNPDAMTAFVFEPTMLPGRLGDGPFVLSETLRIELVK